MKETRHFNSQRDPGSSRPITLLNLDYKILSSILANRLNKVIENYIDEDQTGFIGGQFMKDNVWRLRNVMNKIQVES